LPERAIRPRALGRKNWMFAGSDAGGERAAVLYTLIETAKLNGQAKQGGINHLRREQANEQAAVGRVEKIRLNDQSGAGACRNHRGQRQGRYRPASGVVTGISGFLDKRHRRGFPRMTGCEQGLAACLISQARSANVWDPNLHRP
jgi:hypothetical protein